MSTEKNLSNLVINKVESQTVYDYMKQNSLINEDELYLIPGSEDNATETESGLMSAEDKVKLNSIAEGAEVNVQPDWNITDSASDAYIKNKPTALPADGGNADTVNGHTVDANVPADAVFTDTVYTHPMYDTQSNGLYKITVDNTGHISGVVSVTKDDIVALGVPAEDTTYGGAGAGLGLVQSGGDVTISNGIITVNDDSHNHIVDNVDGLQAALDGKVDKVDGKVLSTNDLTDALKSNYNTAYTHSQQAHAPADAEKNVIIGVQKNGTDLTVNSTTRKVNITVPTKTSDLTNDSDYITSSALDSKVDKVTGKGLSSNDYTTDEKNKLAGIEEGANKTVVDNALNSTSENPVQNKVVNAKFTTVQADIDSKVPSSRKVNGKALTTDITLSASDVGALPNTTQIPSIDGLATETYVDNKVASVVDSAPDTLNTLNELAAALGDDPNFATTVATQIGGKVDKVDGKGLSTNDYTTTEKSKLASIAEGAEVNQNAFSSIVVGSTTISADSKTDALTMTAGDNVTISADADSDKITISAVDTVYTHPSYTSKSSGLYKVTVDNTGHVSATTTVTKSDITNLGIPAQDTTYNTGTSSVSGLTKLYTTTGANTDGTMAQSAITNALNDKVDVANGQYVVTTGGDGAAYTATVPGITTLTAGVSFIMMPHVVSTSTSPTLNVNGLGAKNIRRRLTSIATAPQNGYTASWLGVGLPFRVIYDGTQWIAEGHDKPAGADVYGTVPKATADANGNDIVNTYATKAELQSLLPKSTTISLPAASWTGDVQPYSQVVTINGVTENSKIDLQPTAVQIVELQNANIALMAENDGGTVTVYALGEKPTNDYTMQVLITEVLSV